ncbi:hypothetical protein [Rubrivivax gelatinosus]|uniref:hypothetical protein n=1 Tax=Rubrivivax gelatinosus TaxID=28068 RepID=UPI0012FD03B7|nr:hypothetical protein [Rubrivivax gelatinosus]MBG6081144.1 hypothetical protein [Rubrivivax gelatinosus]
MALKLILVLLIVPAVCLLMVLARRCWPDAGPVRRWLEQQGCLRIATYAVLAVWALGGLGLMVIHS